MHHRVFQLYIAVRRWAIVAKWRWAPATCLLETSHRVFSWWLVHSGVSGIQWKKEKVPCWVPPPLLMLLFWSRTAHTSVLQHLFFFFFPPKKETICEVVLHKPEHMFMCLLPAWADRKGSFLFSPRVVSWGSLNTCLLWRWGRRAGRRKVLPTSLPRWCWGIKPLIYSDLSSLRGASPNTHTHITSAMMEIEMSFPPVSLWCGGAAASQCSHQSYLIFPPILTFLILSTVWWVSAAICRW